MGPLRDTLIRLADSLGISALTWFPGNVSNVAEVLRTFDLFVLPSLAEGISNTLLEAMASGLPLVATATGGNLELVSEGVNGRLFVPGDVDALTRLLSRVYRRAGMLRMHGEQRARMAVRRFSLPTMLASLPGGIRGIL
jgi:glycosyltransferase involved in cell wall biosynthesis